MIRIKSKKKKTDHNKIFHEIGLMKNLSNAMIGIGITAVIIYLAQVNNIDDEIFLARDCFDNTANGNKSKPLNNIPRY